MAVIRVHDLIPLRVLAARGTARTIGAALEAAMREGRGEVLLDFEGVEGLAPSFLDELLAILLEAASRTGNQLRRVVIGNPPARLSSKFAAIGRGRGLRFADRAGEGWEITRGTG
ncbi:MAG: STAS-like domain-containing protein [Acidobacteria bacterium]|nr:STAS-like domain-containing protein [Acidobacteriota bacterium]